MPNRVGLTGEQLGDFEELTPGGESGRWEPAV